MKRYGLSMVLILLLVPGAFAQVPAGPDGPDHRQLIADWQALQTNLTHIARGLEEYIQGTQRYVAKIQADDEAQKATLIEWLKAAQAEATAHTARK